MCFVFAPDRSKENAVDESVHAKPKSVENLLISLLTAVGPLSIVVAI